MKTITIFTPAYNRKKLLYRCYESLKRQTCKDFVWMIIDDGSTDDTYKTACEWSENENGFRIIVIRKTNGGLHTAYNEAIAKINTELCVCIDSDDYMPDNAVEIILDFWKCHGSNKYAGIVGLDYDTNGTIIGDKLPNQKSINLIDLLTGKYKIKNGDRTIVVRSELYKMVAPMPTINNEKNFNPHYLHLLISKKYDFLVLNQNLRYVDYQPEGMSNSILKQYLNSPNSFMETRKLYLSFPNTSLKFKFRHSIHLASSAILSKHPCKAFASPHPLLLLVAFPFGALLSVYILIKAKRK